MTAPTKPSTRRLILGIDLGTTNSLAAVCGRKGPRVLRDAQGDALIPSVVAFPENGEDVLVGKAALARSLEFPERTVFSIKRLIGRSGDDLDAEIERLPYPVERGDRGLPKIRIGDTLYSPEEVSAKILRAVADQASAALGETVQEAVITVPAYFDDGQRQATKDAAELAGLTCLRMVNEPTAASLAYGIDGSQDGTVLVFDLGGGTFDVSILKIEDGVFRVLSTAGDTHLGGDDFDRLLIERILRAIDPKLEHNDLDATTRQAIRASAEGLKKQLSDVETATLQIDLSQGSESTKEVTITRAEFESDIAALVQRTIDCCRDAMLAAREAEPDLDQSTLTDIVLVGGSTRVPLVRRKLEEFAGMQPKTDVDPDLAVALGAALQADVLAGGQSDLLLLDVIPLSLGIETMGQVVSKLILRNATIPSSVTEEFSTQVDNQTAVEINVYQGEREMVADCRRLAAFKLQGIPPMTAGLPRIAVTFTIDADGVLRVTAKESRTGTEAAIQVVPSHGLTRGEVKRMMDASLEHAISDMQAREGVELINKAGAMVIGTRKALEMSDLPPDQTYSVKKAVRALDQLMTNKAPTPEIHAAVEELSRLTAQIADDAISSAVSKALTAEQS